MKNVITFKPTYDGITYDMDASFLQNIKTAEAAVKSAKGVEAKTDAAIAVKTAFKALYEACLEKAEANNSSFGVSLFTFKLNTL